VLECECSVSVKMPNYVSSKIMSMSMKLVYVMYEYSMM
jgi:hypothetical protein